MATESTIVTTHSPDHSSFEPDKPLKNSNYTQAGQEICVQKELKVPEKLNESNNYWIFMDTTNASQCRHVLCLTNLPLDYSRKEFTSLVKSYGDVRFSFLMTSMKTGKSKGYGFVQYQDHKKFEQAFHSLEGKVVDRHRIVRVWLDSGLPNLESLHSTCLFVFCLPYYYCNASEFRELFSMFAKPLFCQTFVKDATVATQPSTMVELMNCVKAAVKSITQNSLARIVMKNRLPQGWGLVEYSNYVDAEATQTRLNGYKLHGHKIEIGYCGPGVRAREILSLLEQQFQSLAEHLLPPYQQNLSPPIKFQALSQSPQQHHSSYWAGCPLYLLTPPMPSPPANYLRTPPPVVPVQSNQAIFTNLSNPLTFQQIFQPSPLPYPTYSNSPLDPSKNQFRAPAFSEAQPMTHTYHSQIAKPTSVPVKSNRFVEKRHTNLIPKGVSSSPQAALSTSDPLRNICSQPSLTEPPQLNDMMTSVGQKEIPLTLSEASPEGNCIGQHFQNLEVQYSESSVKKPKLN